MDRLSLCGIRVFADDRLKNRLHITEKTEIKPFKKTV